MRCLGVTQELERLQKEKDRLERREMEQRGEIDRHVCNISNISQRIGFAVLENAENCSTANGFNFPVTIFFIVRCI